MKTLLDIQDNSHLMEMLKGLSSVNTKTISGSIANDKALFVEEIKEAIENLSLVRNGKRKARPAKELLNAL